MPLQSTWKEEIPAIEKMMGEGVSLEDIGMSYGVSRQRMYQVLNKYGIETPHIKRRTFLKGKEPKYHWLDKMLRMKGLKTIERRKMLEEMDIPDTCPVLGIELNYNGRAGNPGWNGKMENSPSIDRIDSKSGYESGNIQIISWRANRIKSDSTPEELKMLADFMEKFSS